MWQHPVEQTLFINRWDSICGNCHEGADCAEESHESVIGYGVPSGAKGCGVRWEYVTTDYADQEKFARTARKLRPDLVWNEFILEAQDVNT